MNLMNNTNSGFGNTRQSYRRTDKFIIKSTPPTNIKKVSGGPIQNIFKDNLQDRFESKQQPSNEGPNLLQGSVAFPLEKIKKIGSREESELKHAYHKNEFGRESLLSKPVINMDDYVKKSKFDELEKNYELLIKKYADLKTKTKSLESGYRQDKRKNEELSEENTSLKERIIELEAQNRYYMEKEENQYREGEEEDEEEEDKQQDDENEQRNEEAKMSDDEYRSLRLAMRYEAENIFMNQLSQIAALQMLYERPERNIDLNDPNSINPDNMTYEELLQLEERIGKVSRGLTSEQIKNIPKRVHQKESGTEETCSICCCEVEVGAKVRTLPCSHEYHSKCIKQWLLNEKTCPICKKEIPTQ